MPEVKERRVRDSNPRYPFGVYTLSRRAPSTTRPTLRLPTHQLAVREGRHLLFYIQGIERIPLTNSGDAIRADLIWSADLRTNALLSGPKQPCCVGGSQFSDLCNWHLPQISHSLRNDWNVLGCVSLPAIRGRCQKRSICLQYAPLFI